MIMKSVDVGFLVSKSDFLLYRECDKNAWMKIHRPDIFYSSELSEFEKSIIETGNEVEVVARKLFPTGVLVEGRDATAEKFTQELIAKKENIIFQPVFSRDGFFAACDIITYDTKTDSYSVYEVKATTEVKDSLHVPDIAFQVNLLRRCGLSVTQSYILHLDSRYVRAGELDIAKLFITENVTEDVEEMMPRIDVEVKRALEYLSKEVEPKGNCVCIYKGRSKHCATFKHSNPEVPEYSVHDIARIGLSKKKLTELVDGRFFGIHEVSDDFELSDIQRNQVDAHNLDRILKKNDHIAEEFENLVFPLYFLDYETFPSAIPRFDGFSPYQQIPFQYSLHIVNKPGAEIIHHEFLHTDEDDPSLAFVTALTRDIGDKGTVVVWNKKFECKINDEISRRLPSYKPFIDDVNSRVYDLMDVFSKQFYVHKDFRGGTSIKDVLPVLVPELSYKSLSIKEGGTASQKWNEMTTGGLDSSEKSEIANNLREYCKLDTYAMYAIWKHLYDNI